MKKFSGGKIVAGCVIYIFCMMGFLGVFTTGYALYPETYNISISTMGVLTTVITIAGLVASLAYMPASRALKPKGLLYLGIAAVLCYGLFADFLVNMIGLTATFIISGILNSLATYTVLTEILSNWYIEKRAQKISMMMSASMIGMAVYQFLGGFVFSAFGLTKGWLVISIVTAVILLLDVKFLILADAPSKIGETPYGEEQTDPAQAAVEAADGKETSTSRKSLYSNPAFWLALLARLLSCGSVGYIATYATTYFTKGGMSLSTAAGLLSVMSLAAAAFMYISGTVLEKLRVKNFVLILCVAAIVSNLGMVAYGAAPSILILAVIIITYGVGYSLVTFNNLVCGLLFDEEDAANANSKMFAVLMGGNIAMLAIAGFVVDNLGFNMLFVVIALMDAATIIAFFAAVTVAQKQGKKI